MGSEMCIRDSGGGDGGGGDGGSGGGGDGGGQSASPHQNAASALYKFAALMNHSCDPTVRFQRWWAPFTPGARVAHDGIAVARATRALAPGERLTINYAPDTLLARPLAARRAYLLANHDFVCGCARFEAEAADEAAEAERPPLAPDYAP